MGVDHKRLRAHYNALVGQAEVLKQLVADGIRVQEVEYFGPTIRQLNQLEQEFPNIAPPFDLDDHFAGMFNGRKNYNITGLQAAIAAALGTLKAELQTSDSTPVTRTRAFTYVADVGVRSILVSDYGEIQRAFIAQCWKAVIILAGGAIEGILVDLLSRNETSARAAMKAPSTPDLRRWGLSDLINVAVEIKLVSESVEKLSHGVRQFRNLVHPGVQLRSGLKADEEEARIAIEILHMLDRDLA